jgi:quercetin dioxygenase-like cupin family protein
VQIHRFGEDHSLPVAAPGSDFRAGVLARGGPVEVTVLHVPAGGIVGRHAAPARGLLCVVSGEGWASGPDGERRRIRSGDAACWEAGEEGEAGSKAGLTAICVEGELEVLARSVLREIDVVDYDPARAAWFEDLSAFIWSAVADIAVRIEHVGSTSVPGLAAKPIIDIDIVLRGEEDVAPAIGRSVRSGTAGSASSAWAVARRSPARRSSRSCRRRTSTPSSRTAAPTSTTGCCATC